MPRSANFFVPLRVEGWGGRPPLDLDGWDQVTEFSLTVAVRQARARLGGDRRGDGRHRARRLPRALERPQPQRGRDLGGRRSARQLPAADLARPVRGAARGDQALAGRRPLRAGRPAGAAGRRGPRRARRDRRLRAHRRCAAPRRPPRGRRRSHVGPHDPRRRRRPLDRLEQPLPSRRAARRASRASARIPTTSAGSRSTAAPPTPSGSRTPCAPRTPSSPAATSPSRRS